MSKGSACPSVCGNMAYKPRKDWGKLAFEPLGALLLAFGSIAVLGSLATGGGNPFLLVFSIGLILSIIGVVRCTPLALYLVCDTCHGMILESKAIDGKLRKKAEHVRQSLSNSSDFTDLNCTDCEGKMSRAKLTFWQTSGSFTKDAIRDSLLDITTTIQLEGCMGCDLIWLSPTKTDKIGYDSPYMIVSEKLSRLGILGAKTSNLIYDQPK